MWVEYTETVNQIPSIVISKFQGVIPYPYYTFPTLALYL